MTLKEEWQPIDTLPEGKWDLSKTVQLTDGTNECKGYYRYPNSWWTEEDGDVWVDEAFINSEDYSELTWQPTHWRPLRKSKKR